MNDSVTFREYIFKYGGGDCPSGCTIVHYWKFHVYPGCAVQYMGSWGTPLQFPTAIDETVKEILFSASPNPFTTTLSISLQKENLQQADFTITNIIGQPVYAKHEGNLSSTYTKTLDLSYLPAGVYFLEVIAGGERSVRQLVKQ